MTDAQRESVLADIAALRAALGVGVLVSWEIAIVLWPLLDLLERLVRDADTEGSDA